ncbi:hypothetical protein ACLOJK_025487 [Asimina triloba]
MLLGIPLKLQVNLGKLNLEDIIIIIIAVISSAFSLVSVTIIWVQLGASIVLAICCWCLGDGSNGGQVSCGDDVIIDLVLVVGVVGFHGT